MGFGLCPFLNHIQKGINSMKKTRHAAIDRENKALEAMRRHREEIENQDLQLAEDLRRVEALRTFMEMLSPADGIKDVLVQIQNELKSINNKLEHIENRMNFVESGINRFDRLTIRTWERVVSMPEVAAAIEPEIKEGTVDARKYIPKEEIRENALTAAKMLHESGKKITLIAVSELTGYEYHRIAYAWSAKELRKAVEG